jgi:hypothetical protein
MKGHRGRERMRRERKLLLSPPITGKINGEAVSREINNAGKGGERREH